MGHEIIRCECGNDIMEEDNGWRCEKCGLNYYILKSGRLVTEYGIKPPKKEKPNKRIN
jgi:hypothetical protein